MSRRPRSLAGTAASAAAALLLAAAAAEVAVRALRIAPDVKLIDLELESSVYRRSRNPVLGFELKPNHEDPKADLVTSYPRTNSHGQRDLERTLKKPPGVHRVVVLGASVVEGFGIRELDDTICRQLERMCGEGTEVLNFGVSAYCTRAKVELLRVKGLAFDPDEVVLFFTENDFHNFNHEAFALGSPVDRPEWLERLFVASHAFRFLAARLNWFYFGAQADPVAWNRNAIGDQNVVDGFRMLRNLAEEHDFRPVVAVWPRFTDDAIHDTNPMPEGGELVVERLARMEGLPAFRFSTAFDAHRAAQDGPVNPNSRYTLGDHLHPNPEGCKIAAEELKRVLDALRAAAAPLPPRFQDAAAVAASRRLGEAQPKRERIVVNLGNTLLQQGRPAEAIEQYRRALETRPDLAEAHVNWGLALKAQGDLDGAVMRYLAALEIEPGLAHAYYNLGVALAGLGRTDRAVQAFHRTLELQPGFPPAVAALRTAQAELRSGEE